MGCLTVLTGFVLAKTVITLSDADLQKVKDDGLFYAMMFLVLAVANGICFWLKIWKFLSIGSTLAAKMRKEIITKYLKLHLGYFDIDENSPGALLTKLSIDTTQLSDIILSLLGDLVCVIGITVLGLILGFIYEMETLPN